ncbi:MAG: DUF3426 domain-containing protein [Pseudomonadales bacterium]
MSNEMLITCCPYCDTSFRVTEAQLAVASGAVRCGACLQVFSADDHMLEAQEDRDEGTETDLDGPDVAAFTDDVDIDDFPAAVDEVEVQAADAGEVEPEEPESDGDLLPPFDFDGEPVPDVMVSPDRAYQPGGEAQDAGLDGGSSTVEEDSPAPTILLDEYDHVIDDDTSDYTDEYATDEYAGEIELESEPIEDIVGEAGERERLDWRYVAGTIILVVILVLQVAWVKRLELSTHQALAAPYDWMCQRLPCGLPEYADLGMLKATDLVVRAHPEIDKALRIDALIVNRADTRQPFPDVEIRFANMNNRLLAARVFSPREYLRGELTGLKYIPARTEVRISLEIADPGPDATNYRMDLRQASTWK